MIFQRREKRSWWEWARDLVRPRKGWRRGFRYIGKRVQRLPDTPHRIALGFACGALASFTPFFTLHALVAVILAWVIRGNLISAVFGTIVGNPVSFPLIAATSLQLGNWLLGRISDVSAADEKMRFSYLMDHPLDFAESIFVPYLIGGIAPGIVAAAVCYALIRPAVASFQKRRRATLSDRADSLVAERRQRLATEKAETLKAEAQRIAARQAGVLPFPKRAPAAGDEATAPQGDAHDKTHEPTHDPAHDAAHDAAHDPSPDQPQNDNSKSRAL